MATWTEEKTTLSTKVTLDVRIRRPSLDSSLPALVFLHFWGGSNSSWDALALGLDSEYPLIIPSLRGWGESSRGIGTGNYKASDYASDIQALLAELSDRGETVLKNGIILIGHSLGGKIALRQLLDMDDWDSLKGLVLVAPSPAKGMDFGEAMFTMMRGAFGDYETACKTVRNAMLGRKGGEDLYLISSLARDSLRGADEAVVAFPAYGAQENFEQCLIAHATKRIAEGHSLRVLVIEGDERPEGADVESGAMLRACGAEVQYEQVPCGHLIPVEAPKALASLIEEFARR